MLIMLASCDVPDLQVDPRGLMTAAIFDVLTDLLRKRAISIQRGASSNNLA